MMVQVVSANPEARLLGGLKMHPGKRIALRSLKVTEMDS